MGCCSLFPAFIQPIDYLWQAFAFLEIGVVHIFILVEQHQAPFSLALAGEKHDPFPEHYNRLPEWLEKNSATSKLKTTQPGLF